MRRILSINGINIQIEVQKSGQSFCDYQFFSRKYDIWCFGNNWEEAKETLTWVLKDKVYSYTRVPYSQMRTKEERRKWKEYAKLFHRGKYKEFWFLGQIG